MPFEFAAEFFTEEGRRLGSATLAPDWRPALEWVRLEGIREGRLRPVIGEASGEVEPIWDGRAGEPIVAAFRAAVDDVSREIPKSYVRGAVQDASSALVEKGLLASGDVYRWIVTARTSVAVREIASDDDFVVEEVVRPLPLAGASLSAFATRARAAGASDADERPIPVFVPRRVLDEAEALARAAHDVETGGVLVGRLCRDDAGDGSTPPALFLEVTAQIAALHTLAESARLTFTADTWAAVQDALALRRRQEMAIGWWHFHPDFCRLRGCPPERRARCPGASPLFSQEDIHLTRTCFGAGHHVALLVSDSTPAGLTWSMYGWWQGMVSARGFHVLDDDPMEEGAIHGTAYGTPGF
jgi:hypothetical protein